MPASTSDRLTLITGATGMVGSAVLAELLSRGVHCVVIARRQGTVSASQRIERILAKFATAGPVPWQPPLVVEGDLNQLHLGLSDKQLRWLGPRCEQIIHSAASLNFAPADQNPDNEPYRTNCGGTENVIGLCQRLRIRNLHHVSTAYVCGHRVGRVRESENDEGQSFANDYERSKSMTETRLRELADELLVTIYRPSIVIDRSGKAPVSGDRTIYGAFAMYKMLASRFGLPDPGQWMANLGMTGAERKNLSDLTWIARAMATVVQQPAFHGKTFHLTSREGTSIDSLDVAFRIATERWLTSRPSGLRRPTRTPIVAHPDQVASELDQMAAPFVNTFKPYFRDDPTFDGTEIDRVIAATDLGPPPSIGVDELVELTERWSPPVTPRGKPAAVAAATDDATALAGDNRHDDRDEVVVCGLEVRLPGQVDNVGDFETLLWAGQSAIETMPADRLDRSLYFDSHRGTLGKSYTELGGCVSTKPLSAAVERAIDGLGQFDLTHRQFAQVAVAAVAQTLGVSGEALLTCGDSALATRLGIDPRRGGVFVGHSGGTQSGGPLAMATMAEAVSEVVTESLAAFAPNIDPAVFSRDLTASIRRDRPCRNESGGPDLSAYSVARLGARLVGLQGRREVIDAACSSSLLALQHAAGAISAGRLDVAIVGGATFNNVDNLALFSQSQACSDAGSYPFDRRASGLVSSEGYVAIVLVRRSIAETAGLPIHARLVSVGVASDGKGKGLWAPRSEGQQLAIRRAYSGDDTLDVDYLECHATSTQVGDATELESLRALLAPESLSQEKTPTATTTSPLPIGSVKSNLGHLLEAAGLVGLVKCVLAMRRGQIPPSINYQSPNELVDWSTIPVRVVDRTEHWRSRVDSSRPRQAAVNAFGIGGLNAHAVIAQSTRSASRHGGTTRHAAAASIPIAIVGRGVVLPGAANVSELARVLASGQSQISDPPAQRWRYGRGALERGLPGHATRFASPHGRGSYINDFQFDAQSYRIPPKLVQNANPAQLMLIEAVRQAIDEWDGGQWTVDRTRVGVVIGTIFGGQFSNELQVGLRRPEIVRHACQLLERSGLDEAAIADAAAGIEQRLLEVYPALKDETGGFTSSTLASRIARTFDLMGGAAAVDAEEASGGLALITAIEQLESGQLDAMICGVSHRAMDLIAFEQLYRKNQLCNSGRIEDLPADGSRVFPAEGVAIIVLQRMSDARAQGRTILGTLGSITESWTDDLMAARGEDYQRGAASPLPPLRLLQQFGHFGGGQGLVRLIAGTLADLSVQRRGNAGRTLPIRELAEDGYQIDYELIVKPTAIDAAPNNEFASSDAEPNAAPALRVAPSCVAETAARESSPWQVRLQTIDAVSLRKSLQSILNDAPEQWPGTTAHFDSHHSGLVQAGLVARSLDELRGVASDLLNGPVAEQHTAALTQKNGWVRFADQHGGRRVAWLFPGQGSQYGSIPDLYAADAGCVEFLQRFDEDLQALRLSPLSAQLADAERRLGRDLWWTQLWVLGVGSMLADALRRRGHRPDAVLGHSFGECTAAWDAGVLTTRQAIEFARRRSDAVVMTTGQPGQLLSVRAEPSTVAAVVQQHRLAVAITHHNSVHQTVLAGDATAIGEAKRALSATGCASVVISVPAAYHTAAMQPAESLLRTQLSNFTCAPPTCSVLSALSNRYLAEPVELLENLVSQLTTPVSFSGALDRLVADGAGLLLEVGPSDVLTRLARVNTSGRAICLALDDRQADSAARLALIDLACEAVRGSTAASVATSITSVHQGTTPSTNGQHRDAARQSTSPEPIEPAPRRRFEVVDVTRRGTSTRPKPVSNGRPRELVGANGSRHPSSPKREPSIATVAAANQFHHEPTPHEPPWAPTPSLNGDAVAPATARGFLFDLVVDLTGYEPEIIDFDADLESELGVDSIKRAQLIGELIQWANLEVDVASLRLSQFASLSDILKLVETSVLTEASAPREASAAVARSSSRVEVPDSETLRRFMIDLVIDQTGYDEEIIDMDADLEGELGVDSIKKAQLFGELEQQYALDSLRQTDRRLSDFPTLASIHAFILDQFDETATTSLSNDSTNESTNESTSDSLSEVSAANDEKKNDTTACDGLDVSAVAAPVDTDLNVAPVPASGTHRFVLRVANRPRRENMPTNPRLTGDGLVIGRNPLAMAIQKRWLRDAAEKPELGRLRCIDASISLEQLDLQLDQAWANGVSPHLFLTTCHDRQSTWKTSDADAWQARRQAALEVPFRVCQRWMQRMIDDGRMNEASLVTFVRLGGTFGFLPSDDAIAASGLSAESGGMAGLTKAMRIEAWMRGFQDTPMLIVDGWPESDPAAIVDGAWRELAVPSYDEEVAVSGDQRRITQAIHVPLDQETPHSRETPPLTRGGTWLVAGGGRGITAAAAMLLAERHGLKLHLLGTAPVPEIEPVTRQQAIADRAGLRRDTMRRIQAEGGNPVKFWRQYEKAIEIDQTLHRCRERSIRATYHSVDVSDPVAVTALVAKIRDADGPIHGVIQGAGSGQDARFDRKRPDKVNECFRAKIDGCAALAAAVRDEPLEWFIGFGSISGRFGANGHTDYSAANDMLAKMIGRLRHEWPSTRCVTFHWHAWGDIGMATKPEAKLALEMIGMEFMPAEEGLRHFIDEIERGGNESEVLITDRRYIRKFFPDGEGTAAASKPRCFPMLEPSGEAREDRRPSSPDNYGVTLVPARDRFLKEHLVGGRPTLPLVIAAELLAEAATKATGSPVRRFRQLRALAPIKSVTDDPFAIELIGPAVGEGSVWTLASDLRRRDGRIVQSSRPHFTAIMDHVVAPEFSKTSWDDDLLAGGWPELTEVVYLDESAPVYHGPSLRCLRRVGWLETTRGESVTVGQIVTPSPAHLTGEHRPVGGWLLPPAVMDAVLYAAGMLAYRVAGRPSLPVAIEDLLLGRMPDPGEPLRATLRWHDDANESAGGLVSAVLRGHNGDVLLRLDRYRVGWLS